MLVQRQQLPPTPVAVIRRTVRRLEVGVELLGPFEEAGDVYGHWQDSWNRDPSLIRTDVFYQLSDA